jgi:two-component system sensor histidine kinase AtoS
VELLRHKRLPIKVITRLMHLENKAQLALISIVPSNHNLQNQNLYVHQKNLLTLHQSIPQLFTQPDLDTALSLVINIGLSILGCDILCIYHAESHIPILTKTIVSNVNTSSLLPNNIPSTDLMHLTTPLVWIYGKRVSAELHRIARVNNFNYLASAPLGQQGAWSGLLVAANKQSPPDDELLEILVILANHISAVLQHYIALENAQAAILESKRFFPVYRGILENTQEGLIIIKPDLSILEMNPTAELMLGYTSQEVSNHPVENVLIGTETLTSALNAAVQGIPTHNLGSLSLHRRNGKSFPAQIKTVPILLDGNVSKIIIFLNDHSNDEQVRIHTQQLEQRALLGEVNAIFAHEVRNPINNISMGLQLMSQCTIEGLPEPDLIIRMQGDCARLTGLMDSVLSFSKGTEYKFESTDLMILIQRILDRWRPRLANAKVESFLTSTEQPLVEGDPRALEQVFTNLISNAVNAMRDKGGLLAIKIGPQDQPSDPPQWVITIADSGSGIPDEIKDRVFEPFVTTNKQSGTGLGLAITSRIIIAHRGSIKVESFPGGTVFSIFLPVFSGA